MSGDVSQIYRFSNLGKSLIKTLSDLEKEGKITSTQKESILNTFDKKMIEEFDKRQSELPKAKIHGEISYYNRWFDTWTFTLSNWLVNLDNVDSLMEKEAKFTTTKCTQKE